MVSTLVFLALAWSLTVPVVLALAKLLGRVTAPRATPPRVEVAPRATPRDDNVVPLVPRPRNALVPVRAEGLREAS